MKGYFSFCDAGLPQEPYASMYLIITRCCRFLDGKPYGFPLYKSSRARYEGNGLWRELCEFDCLPEPSDDDFDPFETVSAGMEIEFMKDPDFFENGGNADVKVGVDVIAYCPLPKVPDLSMHKPMELK
jgi:hypothetical protein